MVLAQPFLKVEYMVVHSSSIFKLKNPTTFFYLLAILIVVAFLYQRYQNKLDRDNDSENYESIQKFLLNDPDDVDTKKIKKPILWIHLNYEYNSRSWVSFGSRSTLDLNQPYLYLTVMSIIKRCKDSFHICLIDDKSFEKLLPEWSIDLTRISNPTKGYIRDMAMMKLMYKYGGIIVPASFVCMNDLIGLYNMGTSQDKLFSCEMVNRKITSTEMDFYPSIRFMGTFKENPVVEEMIEFMQRTISTDFTDENAFLGGFSRWINKRIERNQINLINGKLIGTKTMEDTPIILDNLLSQDYIEIYLNTYGIYIPEDEVLKRVNYEWFARMSPKQVLESKFIIAKYLLLANAPAGEKMGTIEPMRNKPNWVSFWNVPSGAPVWGLKPNDLGNNISNMSHPSQ